MLRVENTRQETNTANPKLSFEFAVFVFRNGACMRMMPQNTSEENAANVTAVDLMAFAYTLRGERIARPACVEPRATLSETEYRQREQARHAREQELLGQLLRQFKRKSRHRRFCLRYFTLTGGFALITGMAMMLDSTMMDALVAPFEVMAAFALVIMCAGTWLHSQMATLIATIPASDVRAIGPLLEAMRLADMEGIPQRALKELLPQLNPADAVLFTDAHRHALHFALDDPNTDLVVLLLKALEHIGDGRSISAVKRLANGGGRARVDPQVLYAAQHCLPLLEARSIHDDANQTLLRASVLEPGKGTELLRSVAHQPDNAPDELLHPMQETKP